MTDLTKIKTKITALLAKAEGTDNEFEANTFMAKVNELMEKHQIAMHELGDQSDQMGHQRGDFNMYASMTWGKILTAQICRYYGCETMWYKNNNHILYDVIGRESARITAELMIPFIISQVRQKAKKLASEFRKTRSVAEREVGHALTGRIANMLTETKEHREAHARSMLVPVNEIESYLADMFANAKKGREQTLRYGQAAKTLASEVSLHHQTPNAAGTKAIAG
jgi:hypothetical protein